MTLLSAAPPRGSVPLMKRWRRIANGGWQMGLAAALVTGWSAVATAEPSPAPTPITRYQLPNGLRVVLAPDRVTPGVSVVVRYDVGLANDPSGYRGLSHLLEHLTFRGSRHLAPLQGMDILQELGGGFNAATGLEATEYYAQVAAPALSTVLWLESERMAFTLDRLDQAALDIERRIVANEHRQRHSIREITERYWLQALYGKQHPFADDPQSLWDISDVTLSGVQWFFQTAYRPDNATVTVVGQFDLSQVQSSIEKYFGPVVSPSLPRVSLRAGGPRLCGVHRLGLAHAGLFGHTLRITWPLPRASSPEERASVDILAELLERRLNGLLVEDGVDVAKVNASLIRVATHELLNIDLQLHEKSDAAPVEQLVLREAKALAKQPPPPAALRLVIANLVSSAIFRREDGLRRALDLASGGDPDADAAALRHVNAQQVLRAAQPLAGPVLVVHAWAERHPDGIARVVEEENPCH